MPKVKIPTPLRQYTGDGKLRSFVNVYKGDEDIRYLDGPETSVSESDELSIIPSIAGGSAEGVVEGRCR